MSRFFVAAALAAVMFVGYTPLGNAGGEEVSIGYYVGGGSAGGVTLICLLDSGGAVIPSHDHDALGVCDLPCPGGTCNIEVRDDVRGNNISFRICFEGETFCRPNVYTGFANVPGSKVTVVPQTERGTRSTVYVR